MKRPVTGEYVTISTVGETCQAFVPSPLPPEPHLSIDPDLRSLLDEALLALGRLDSVSLLLPDTALFLYAYVRKEALLSSQIEGTQSSLSDLLVYEAEGVPGVPIDDVQEVSNYVAALDEGLLRMRDGFPLSLRLIKDIHRILLEKGRGSKKQPGEFRTSQNWIGGSRPGNAVFVPPPPERILECIGAFEKFLHNEPEKTEILIKAALAHVQFETIHPFLDGNGRLGRLLITLLFCNESILREPLLYLSLYFKAHRTEYYDLLQKVRLEGEWEEWIHFFAAAVKETAMQAVETATRLVALAQQDRERVGGLGKAAGSALRVHHALLQQPIISIAKIRQMTGLAPTTIIKSLDHLIKLGVANEITGRQRNKLYSYQRYIAFLSEGAEPIHS